MSELAIHMRITSLHVTDQDVDSRKAAIAALKKEWLKNRTFAYVFEKASDIASALNGDGTPSDSLGNEVQKAVQKKASAFLYVERPLDVGIVAGMVAKEILEEPPHPSGWTWTDVWAAALWSGLGFQPQLSDEKREALRLSVLNAAHSRSVAGAEEARQRTDVPDFGAVSLEAGEEEQLVNTVKKATTPTIDALRRNSALDREELDFLWWSQLSRSRLLKRPLDAINEVSRVVAAGIEGATYLRRMPCEVHRDVVLRTINTNPTVALSGVIEALGPDRETLKTPYQKELSEGGATIFPLLTAINKGTFDETLGANIERTAEEWGSRALLEAALLRIRSLGPGQI